MKDRCSARCFNPFQRGCGLPDVLPGIYVHTHVDVCIYIYVKCYQKGTSIKSSKKWKVDRDDNGILDDRDIQYG